jgi:predicted component of type VI protein secretion system
MAALFVLSGRNRGYYFPLASRNLVAGRDQNCEIQVLDPMVSRRHAAVRFEPRRNRHWVQDLGSRNGVFVNGYRAVHPLSLKDGDVVELGESRLLYTTRQFMSAEAAMSYFRERGQRDQGTAVLHYFNDAEVQPGGEPEQPDHDESEETRLPWPNRCSA